MKGLLSNLIHLPVVVPMAAHVLHHCLPLPRPPKQLRVAALMVRFWRKDRSSQKTWFGCAVAMFTLVAKDPSSIHSMTNARSLKARLTILHALERSISQSEQHAEPPAMLSYSKAAIDACRSLIMKKGDRCRMLRLYHTPRPTHACEARLRESLVEVPLATSKKDRSPLLSKQVFGIFLTLVKSLSQTAFFR